MHLILATRFANLFTQIISAVSLQLMTMTSNKENEASLSKYSEGQQWLHSVRKWTEIARWDIWFEACTSASVRVSQVSLTKTGGKKVIKTHSATLFFNVTLLKEQYWCIWLHWLQFVTCFDWLYWNIFTLLNFNLLLLIVWMCWYLPQLFNFLTLICIVFLCGWISTHKKNSIFCLEL